MDASILTPQNPNFGINAYVYGKLALDKSNCVKYTGTPIRQLLPQLQISNQCSDVYGGGREGSNYQNVMECWETNPGLFNAAAQTLTVIVFSGASESGFSIWVNDFMLNGYMH